MRFDDFPLQQNSSEVIPYRHPSSLFSNALKFVKQKVEISVV